MPALSFLQPADRSLWPLESYLPFLCRLLRHEMHIDVRCIVHEPLQREIVQILLPSLYRRPPEDDLRHPVSGDILGGHCGNAAALQPDHPGASSSPFSTCSTKNSALIASARRAPRAIRSRDSGLELMHTATRSAICQCPLNCLRVT